MLKSLIKKPINLTQQENLKAQFNVSPFKKNLKKPIYDRIKFSGFMVKQSNFTELNRFGLYQFSVWFDFNFPKFELLGSVDFCSSNRTVNNPN
jgi:hypothetical protein